MTCKDFSGAFSGLNLHEFLRQKLFGEEFGHKIASTEEFVEKNACFTVILISGDWQLGQMNLNVKNVWHSQKEQSALWDEMTKITTVTEVSLKFFHVHQKCYIDRYMTIEYRKLDFIFKETIHFVEIQGNEHWICKYNKKCVVAYRTQGNIFTRQVGSMKSYLESVWSHCITNKSFAFY